MPRVLRVAALLCLVLLGAFVSPAMAKDKGPCWKQLINDWYDGRIDGTYAVSCYTQALKHLPTDVDAYSSARADINAALKNRITTSYKKDGVEVIPGGQPGNPSGPNFPTTGGGKGPKGGGTTPGGKTTPGGGTIPGGGRPDRSTTKGPIGDALEFGRPASADSLPIPLIVLGALALLLMAAGAAGFVARRMRTRRLQLASIGGLNDGSPPQPPPSA